MKIKKILIRTGITILVTLLMVFVLLYSVMWVCINGPSIRAKNLLVMSLKETSAVKFVPGLYLSKEEIKAIMDSNAVEVADENTDTSLIVIDTQKGDDNNQSDNQEGSASGDENKEEKDLEFVTVKGATYKGTMVIIKDPSRVLVGISGEYGADKEGRTVAQICNGYGATLATNAGGFKDEKGLGLGGEPLGMVISEGVLRYGGANTVYEIGGFNKDNIFVVGRMTANQAMAQGIRDAVSFGPILVVNGVPSTINGTGGGLNPRTAIGQRSDGAVLLLVIDGRQTSSVGATYQDLVSIMVKYGAVNAINLDGGSSTVMYYNGNVINSVSTGGTLRKLPTAILVK